MTIYMQHEYQDGVRSRREYKRLFIPTSRVYGSRDLELYIDQETGIVVSDIGKFERWIGESK